MSKFEYVNKICVLHGNLLSSFCRHWVGVRVRNRHVHDPKHDLPSADPPQTLDGLRHIRGRLGPSAQTAAIQPHEKTERGTGSGAPVRVQVPRSGRRDRDERERDHAPERRHPLVRGRLQKQTLRTHDHS